MKIHKKTSFLVCFTLILSLISSMSVFSIEKPCDFNLKNIFKDIKYLSSEKEFPAPNYRLAGTEGEKKAANFVKTKFTDMGLDFTEQSFQFNKSNFEGYLKDLSTDTEINYLAGHGFTINNKPEQVKWVSINEGTEEDINKAIGQLENSVILLKYTEKTNVNYLIQNINSVKGIILYIGESNTSDNEVNSYYESNLNIKIKNTLDGEASYFEFIIDSKIGEEYMQKLNSGAVVELEVCAKTTFEKQDSQNIISVADTCKETDKEIIICAHYDGVDCLAANDNASGTATMIELANSLKNQKLNYDIKFIAFGSEEVGLIGSYYYVESMEGKTNNIEYVIDLDMVGVGDTLGIFKNREESDNKLVDIADTVSDKIDIKHETNIMGRSDHVYFDLVGVRSIMLSYLDDPNYHTTEDTFKNLLESNKVNDNIENICTIVTKILKTV